MDEALKIAVQDLVAGDTVLRSDGSVMYAVLESAPLEVSGIRVHVEFPSGAQEWRFWEDASVELSVERI